MTTQLLRNVIRKSSAVMILAGLLVFGAVGKAAAGNKPAPQSGGGGAHPSGGGGGSHGPSGGGVASHGSTPRTAKPMSTR